MGGYPDLYNPLAERMTRQTDIPHGPIALGYSLGGLLPQVGLHRRGQAFHQESSYWHLALAVPFLVGAIVLIFLPVATYTKCVWVGFLVFTAACGAAPYFVRNRFGQKIIIDPEARIVCIKQAPEDKTILWSDIVALQLCRQEQPSVAYQINLVWKSVDGSFERRCVAVHEVRRYAMSLARRYESLLSVRLTDESVGSQRGGAANRSQPVASETNQTSVTAGSGR
jgi:hypothetical protein